MRLLSNLGSTLYDFLDRIGDPWLFVLWGLIACFAAIIGVAPLTLGSHHNSRDATLVGARYLLAGLALFCGLGFPLFLWVSYYWMLPGDTFGKMGQAAQNVGQWYAAVLSAYWVLPVIGLLVGLAARFAVIPYATVKLSEFWKRVRVKQKSDKRSDVNEEHSRYAGMTIDFDPKQYYRLEEGLLFVGLHEDGTPHYWPIGAFKERHLEIIGSTGLGKGCFLQMLLDQTIRLGWGAFINDPKWDKRVPYVLQAAHAACLDTGKKFIYHDLNESGGMVWQPFVGSQGTLREHNIARLVSAWRLNDVADNSAVYKGEERYKVEAFADEDAKHGRNGLDLSRLANRADKIIKESQQKNAKVLPRYLTGVLEWARRKAFTARQNVKPFSVAKAIEDRAVTYIRGSLTDHLVQDAMRIMIVEYLQEIERLSANFPKDYHFVMVIDELPQVLCDQILRGLRTMRTFNCTIVAVYQSAQEIKTLNVADVSGPNAVATLHENCQYKLLYGTIDFETADWSSKQTGTVEKTFEVREGTEQSGRGAEWNGDVTYQKDEVQLITANEFLQLPARVGAVLGQGEIAKVVRTCFVNVPGDKQFAIPAPVEAEDVITPPANAA